MPPKAQKGMTVRLDLEELAEVRAAITVRRDQLEKVRGKLADAGLSSFVADSAIEILDRCKVAIGDEPEDLFNPSTGEYGGEGK